MAWVSQALNSSIGKKLFMSLTGLFLITFLCVHLFGNMFLYVGQDAFNLYVHTLETGVVHAFILVTEVILVAAFLIHIINAIRLTLGNWAARPQRYAVKPAQQQSESASRTMWISASIIFIFLAIHLVNFWYVFKYGTLPPAYFIGEEKNYFMIVTEALSTPWIATVYLAAVFLLGFHLYHGFQSAFQTLGINHKKYTPFILFVGRAYAVIVAAGFASFPIYFTLLHLLGGK
jgi:succinate dehydrogenase / fumarate reductase cytochrome b subunit